MEEKTMNKMMDMPVNKLMLNMGMPMIISMILQAVYNIVDSAFVSNMKENGEMALNALTLAFPIQMLMVAVGIGTGVGTNVLLARKLGEGSREEASKTAGNGIFLGIVIYLFFALFGLFGVKAYIASQTANTVIFEMAVDYLRICCMASIGIVFFSVFEKLLQATGCSIYSTIAQIAGALVNIVLDPVLIYGLFGFAEMGVKGAAYATVIGQIVSFITAFLLHLKYNNEISNGFEYLKPSLKTITEIYSVGLPAIIAQALTSVMTYILNIIFVRIGESVVTAYGLFYKIQQFILFAAFGLRDAITPIVSYNMGMGSKKRIKDGMKYGMIYTLAIMIAGVVILEVFAGGFAEVFELSGETKILCISAMRIIALSFVFAGANIAFQGIFQALGRGFESLVISVCRQILFVLPVAWGFGLIAARLKGYTWLVWFSFPIAELLTSVIAVIYMKKIYDKISIFNVY